MLIALIASGIWSGVLWSFVMGSEGRANRGVWEEGLT